MTVHRLAPILLIALCAPVLCAPLAQAQESVDDLAELIRTSSQSADPNIGFITGFAAWGDFRFRGGEIDQALANADVPSDGPLRALLAGTKSITKRGSRVEIQRRKKETFTLSGGAIRFEEKVAFDLKTGSVDSLEGDDARRMRDARGGLTHLDDIDGIKVSEGGGASFYTLYELYYVREESGTVTAHIKAGMWAHKEWKRIPFEDDVTADAGPAADVTTDVTTDVTESPVAHPLVGEVGLPLPTNVRDLATDETDAGADETDVVPEAPSTTPVTTQSGQTAQARPARKQGILDRLEPQSP